MNIANIKVPFMWSLLVANIKNSYSKPVLEMNFHTWIKTYKKTPKKQSKSTKNVTNQTMKKLFPAEIQLDYPLPTGQRR